MLSETGLRSAPAARTSATSALKPSFVVTQGRWLSLAWQQGLDRLASRMVGFLLLTFYVARATINANAGIVKTQEACKMEKVAEEEKRTPESRR